MRIVVLGGAGAMGQVAVRDLAASTQVREVVIADLSLERAESLRRTISSAKVLAAAADIGDHEGLVSLLKGSNVVINSSPYQLNVPVMEAALAANCNYVDLGGLFHVTRKQLQLHEQFQERKLLAVPGMGAAPGMTNVMAAHAAADLDTVESIDMVVAGVDFCKTSHPFLPPYALDTILDEYALEPMVYEKGKFLAKPPMSGECFIDLPEPVGRVQAFLTLHSEIATLPLTYANKGIKQCTYRLGLPAEFHEKAKFLVQLGFAATDKLDIAGTMVHPRKVLAAIIGKHPSPQEDPDDCEVVRVDVKGIRGGRSMVIRMESTISSHSQWKVSCGALDTGVPPSIVAQMIAQGAVDAVGVVPPEQCVPSGKFFAELAKRGIPMRRLIDEELAAVQNSTVVAV